MVRISVKPLKGYSFVSLARQALNGHKGWPAAWRSPATRKGYDVIIIGAGGHGLATAYYLARNHGVTDVAVIEKRWLGSGNSGRNTQVTRSNYFWPQSAAFYDHSLKLFENLGRKINFNVMLSQRGVLNLAHSVHELESLRRWANAIRVNGIDSEVLAPKEIKKLLPLINLDARFPVHGGFIRQWAGTVDITPDTTPIMGQTPLQNLYMSGGWGTGGYKAIPAGGDTMAYTIVHDEPHPLIEGFGLERFERGAPIDEGAASGVAH